MGKHTLYYNLRDAFAEGGCPVCRLCSQAVDRYLDHLLYESVNDPGVRERIRRNRGFCNEHAWQLQQKGGALGIAIIYQDVVVNLLRTLDKGRGYELRSPSGSGPGSVLRGVVSDAAHQLAGRPTPTTECPACQQRSEVAQAYLETLLQHTAEPELLASWRVSDGLCWPHLQQACRLSGDEATLQLLVDMESAHLRRLRDELSAFIRHHDYRFQHEELGTEGDSWIRVVAKVSGRQRS